MADGIVLVGGGLAPPLPPAGYGTVVLPGTDFHSSDAASDSARPSRGGCQQRGAAAAAAAATDDDDDDDVGQDGCDGSCGSGGDVGQAGFRKMKAATLVLPRTALAAAYAMIWLVYFVDSAQQGATTALAPWVTSAFRRHSLTPTVNMASQVVGGVFKLTLARMLDVFGRPQGYLVSVVLATAGYALMAACRGIATYAAAQVLCSVGLNGMGYCLTVFVADTSSLRNRGLVFAYSTSPYIVTAWLAGPLSEALLRGPGFRWGFGAFAVATPLAALPLYALFAHYEREAGRRGLLLAVGGGGGGGVGRAGEHRRAAGLARALVRHGREFDVVGLVLLSAGLGLVLLPFNIYALQPLGWRSPLVGGLLAAGVALVALFVVWERRYAAVQFMPYALLADRTVLGACVLAAVSFVSFFIWDAYFASFLQVVHGLSVAEASYVSQIYSVGSCLWALAAGLVIRRTGRFKRLALWLGVPLSALGVGLMVRFRRFGAGVGPVVGCQVLVAVAGGTVAICEQTAAMAAAPRRHVAAVLAVEAMFAALGGAVGLSCSAALWQAVFPARLRAYLPAGELGRLEGIYGRLDVQLSYPLGSPARIAIQRAYGDGQKALLVASTAVLAVAFVAVAAWRDINVKQLPQVRGSVV